MHHTRLARHALTVALLTTAGPLGAQCAQSREAFEALLGTVPGALPPNVVGPDAAVARASLGLSYAHANTGFIRRYDNVAATLAASVVGGRGALTVGTSRCGNCESNYMAGVSWEAPLWVGGSERRRLSAALQPQASFSTNRDVTDGRMYSAAIGVPLAVTVKPQDDGRELNPLRATLFVVPALGYGSADGLGGGGPARLVGGGVRLDGVHGFAFSFGLQRIVIDGARTTFGLGATMPLGR